MNDMPKCYWVSHFVSLKDCTALTLIGTDMPLIILYSVIFVDTAAALSIADRGNY